MDEPTPSPLGATPIDDAARQQAFMSALVTEHFTLQTMSGTTTTESSSRASLYLLTLSSSLVALGFTAQASRTAFTLFAAAVLPTLFLLGCFTVVRLVDASITNINCLRQIAHIRRYYAGLTPDAATYFPSSGTVAQDSLNMLGVQRGRLTLWFTTASMIGVVNAAVAGSGLAILLNAGIGANITVAVITAIVVAAACAAAAVRYQQSRFDNAFPE